MQRYFIGNGYMGQHPVGEAAAVSECGSPEEVKAEVAAWRAEILAGKFDEEYCIEYPDERPTYAEDIYAFVVEYEADGKTQKNAHELQI